MAFDLKKIFSSLTKQTGVKSSGVVGIDIGASSIKVVEIGQSEKALTLHTYGELQLGPYAEKSVGDIVTLESSKLAEAMVDVLRESNVKATDGVLAIPLESSFVTVIPITVRETESIDAKIRVEARKYIPIPLSDITLDWTELHEYGDKDKKIHEILLAAMQTDAINKLQLLMSRVNMDSQPSEIEIFSTIRSNYKADDTTLAIIDIGAETSKLYIVNGGALERIHRVYEGGVTCTKRIASLLNVTFEEAENMKRTYDPSSAHARDIYQSHISSIERSVQEFKRVMEQYEARAGKQIARTIVTGGGASFLGTATYLSDVLSRGVTKANPFAKVAYPAFMEDTVKEIGPSFSTALGAALRPFEVRE